MTLAPVLASLEFPPIGELVDWKGFLFKGTVFEVNKTVVIFIAATVIVFGLFLTASRKRSLVPTGVQNLCEATVEFIQNGIILQTIGEEGLGFTPFLLCLFCFILVCNIFEVIPVIQWPATARMAFPMFGALLAWVIFNVVGIKSQGFGGYLKSALVPPGVPKALLVLVTPIELLSVFIVRPLTLAIRLFANELAGHLLLVTFALLSATLFAKSILIVAMPLPFIMLVLFTGFEVLVAVLQAFIFTILTGVYIGAAMHPEH